jgi:hypothetical protein
VELPVSTTVILRSIADIARSHGEDLAAPVTKVACMEVFALGSRSKADDAGETGYFAVRGALAQAVSEATSYLAQKTAARQTAPALVRFITQIAERFGVAVSEKIVAQGIPVLGAGGGAFINLLFMDHFQDMARGHFTVRRLERTYGKDEVKAEYTKLVP